MTLGRASAEVSAGRAGGFVPVVAILAPISNLTVNIGSAILFSGTATDVQEFQKRLERFVADVDYPVTAVAVLAEAVSALLNNGMAVAEMGTAAVPIELAVVDWMCRRLGLPEDTARQLMRQQLAENAGRSGASAEYLVPSECRDGGRLDRHEHLDVVAGSLRQGSRVRPRRPRPPRPTSRPRSPPPSSTSGCAPG